MKVPLTETMPMQLFLIGIQGVCENFSRKIPKKVLTAKLMLSIVEVLMTEYGKPRFYTPLTFRTSQLCVVSGWLQAPSALLFFLILRARILLEAKGGDDH